MKYSVITLIMGSSLLAACSTPNYYPEQQQFMQPTPIGQNVKNNSAAYPTVNFSTTGCKGLYEPKGYNCVPQKEERVRVIHQVL